MSVVGGEAIDLAGTAAGRQRARLLEVFVEHVRARALLGAVTAFAIAPAFRTAAGGTLYAEDFDFSDSRVLALIRGAISRDLDLKLAALKAALTGPFAVPGDDLDALAREIADAYGEAAVDGKN